MIDLTSPHIRLRLFAPGTNWVEGDALKQLQHTAGLEGMDMAVGLPDLHPGRGTPVGAAFFNSARIYPHIIGNDVGCGIGLWQTTLKSGKVKRDKWAKKLSGLEHPWDGETQDWLARRQLPETGDEPAHGTIGGGNHFAELHTIEKIHNEEHFTSLDLSNKHLFLLVHSGSRSIGERLFRTHTSVYGAKGLAAESDEAAGYLQTHDHAVKWAASNRALIAHRFCQQLGAKCQPVSDACHNSITSVKYDTRTGWLHRKGAAPSDQGPLVIPGSRGSLTYLVAPVGDQEQNLWSIAHGAGRKWNRKSCKERISRRFNASALRRTEMGSLVICDDKQLLYEEAPEAYKKIDAVVNSMTGDGLIQVIATLRPLITYKMRKSDDSAGTW